MKQAVPYLGRFLSKLCFEIIPGALVSMLAAYFLSMLHLAQGAEPAVEAPAVAVIQNDGLSADERRELTRQILKERRENPEEPAEVKPVPSLRPNTPHTETADLSPVTATPVAAPPAKAEIKTETRTRAEPELKPRSEPRSGGIAVAPAPSTPLPRPPAPRVRSEPAVAALTPAAAPTSALMSAPAVTGSLPPAATGVTSLPPVSVTVSPPPGADISAEPPRRGIVGNVFSGISTIAGGAANLTGNTVNWVIDLPGKAISAGGKLLGGNSSASSAPAPAAAPSGLPAAAPAAVPAPSSAPTVDPQRRNYL